MLAKVHASAAVYSFIGVMWARVLAKVRVCDRAAACSFVRVKWAVNGDITKCSSCRFMKYNHA